MKLIPFLSQSNSLDSSSSQCPFPSCANLNTLSFRNDDMIPTVSSCTSFLPMSDDGVDPIESVIHGLRSERLFFEPESSCSLLVSNKQPDPGSEVVYKESEALCMDSNNPCEDFRRSMEEMVEAHGLKDWQGLEELLGCYLKINDKANHGFIMAAFIDLLVNNLSIITPSSTTSSSSTTTTTTTTCLSSNNNLNSSPSSPLSLPSSSLTTPCLSSLLDHDHDDDDVHDGKEDDGRSESILTI